MLEFTAFTEGLIDDRSICQYAAAVVADVIAEAAQTDVKYTTRRVEMRGLQLRDAWVVVGDGCRDRLFEA